LFPLDRIQPLLIKRTNATVQIAADANATLGTKTITITGEHRADKKTITSDGDRLRSQGGIRVAAIWTVAFVV